MHSYQYEGISRAIEDTPWSRDLSTRHIVLEREGYEIFFRDSQENFEFIMRDAETLTKKSLLDTNELDIPRLSPFHTALMLHVIEEPELYAKILSDDGS